MSSTTKRKQLEPETIVSTVSDSIMRVLQATTNEQLIEDFCNILQVTNPSDAKQKLSHLVWQHLNKTQGIEIPIEPVYHTENDIHASTSDISGTLPQTDISEENSQILSYLECSIDNFNESFGVTPPTRVPHSELSNPDHRITSQLNDYPTLSRVNSYAEYPIHSSNLGFDNSMEANINPGLYNHSMLTGKSSYTESLTLLSNLEFDNSMERNINPGLQYDSIASPSYTECSIQQSNPGNSNSSRMTINPGFHDYMSHSSYTGCQQLSNPVEFKKYFDSSLDVIRDAADSINAHLSSHLSSVSEGNLDEDEFHSSGSTHISSQDNGEINNQ